MSIYTFEGILSRHETEEADALYLSGVREPVCEAIGRAVSRKTVTVRYWSCSQPCTKKEASEEAVVSCMGKGDYAFGAVYSEMTGYLWTDEELNIGGHNLISELSSHEGRYLIVEVEVHS